MAITRNTGALIGTSESTGVTLATGATVYTSGGSVTTEIDLLGANDSVADIWLYLVFTTAAVVGTVDVTFLTHRVTGQGYTKNNPDFQIAANAQAPGLFALGKRPCARYIAASILNNATGLNLTNLALLYEFEKLT